LRRLPLAAAGRILLRAAVVFLILFALLLAAGRILPVASTLMLGRWATGQAVSRQWQPLEALSPFLVRGVIGAEDQRFCRHRGVDFIALRAVLSDEDGPSRGASTVTMQTVKNVYLWPGRSYVRKALEIPLALVVDLVWGKRRVMEVYLNIAEWGEGIFGAEAAAQHYFGKHARDLGAAEAARLVAILPNPILRTPRRASGASRRVLRRMIVTMPLSACLGPLR
jgi:monofunctional glycosyltransferase